MKFIKLGNSLIREDLIDNLMFDSENEVLNIYQTNDKTVSIEQVTVEDYDKLCTLIKSKEIF